MNDDKKKSIDELAADLDDLSKKYNHYALAGEEDEIEGKAEAENRTEALKEESSASVYEDISSYSDFTEKSADDFFINSGDYGLPEGEQEDKGEEIPKVFSDKKEGFFSKNNHRNAKITALVLVIVLLLGSCGFLIWFWYSTKGVDYRNNGIDINDPNHLEEEIFDEEQFKSMGDVQDSNSLNQWLKNWALNGGEKMSSKNVINVLLCGVDSEDGTASKARSDSMIIVSVNKKTKTISMISLLRDSWTYMSLPREDGSHYDYYFKMNGAYSLGGPATLVETIENNFKIEIDQYIAVDFASFKKLIDALGGVTVEVTQAESSFIRRTSSQKDFPVGEAKLNGKQALIYSRIRHLDDDLMRTGRQRKIIKSLIESAKTATNGQLLNAFKQTAKYMRTGYSQSEVMSLIAQAYTYKWMEFDMKEVMLPNTDYVDRFSTYIGTQWAWVVDFVLCAKTVQETIYGESNIIISEDRVSALDFVTNSRKSTGGRSSGSSQSDTTRRSYYSSDDEDDYDSGYSRDHEDYNNDEPQYDPVDPEPQDEPSVDPEPQHEQSGGDSGQSGEGGGEGSDSGESAE